MINFIDHIVFIHMFIVYLRTTVPETNSINIAGQWTHL